MGTITENHEAAEADQTTDNPKYMKSEEACQTADAAEIKQNAAQSASVRGGVKRKAANFPSGSPAKQVKVSESDKHSSEEASESEEESSSEEEAPSRRSAKAKAKVGVRRAQSKVMSKSAFLDSAEAFDCRIGNYEFKLEPRQFNTGSCGW